MVVDDLPDEQRADVEMFIADWLTDHRIPGAAVAVVNGDRLAYQEGFGARKLDENEPATPRTLFGMGSCTKSFTAAAIMQLDQQGDLSIEDSVDNFLPHLIEAPGEPITIRELLTHTSGLPADLSSPIFPHPDGIGHLKVPLSSRADFRRHIQGTIDRRVTDRDTFFYYNAGYTMLGQIVEKVSGQPIAEYVDEHLLSPLGMERSTFFKDEFEAIDDRMESYVNQDGSSTPSKFPFGEFIHASGGLISSVDEMATWLQTFIGQGTFQGNTILASPSVEEMTTAVAKYRTYFTGRVIEYGYGLTIEKFLGDQLVGHGGAIGVSNAYFGYLENAELGVIIACSTEPEAHVRAVGMAILAILRGEEPEDVVPHYKLISTLDRACGKYSGYSDIAEVTVERSGGDLSIEKDYGFGTEESLLKPKRIDDRRLICTRVDINAFEQEVRFEFNADDVALFVDRTRYSKLT